MKEFQSVFRNELEEYLKSIRVLSMRTPCGYTRVLLSFDSSLAEEIQMPFSEAAVNRWIRDPPDKRRQNGQRQGSYLVNSWYLGSKGCVFLLPDCPKTSDSYAIYLFRRGNTILLAADSW
ncbi:MAG: hypothetical protein ACLU6W_09920 [Lachnospiraceae bacterium]